MAKLEDIITGVAPQPITLQDILTAYTVECFSYRLDESSPWGFWLKKKDYWYEIHEKYGDTEFASWITNEEVNSFLESPEFLELVRNTFTNLPSE